MVVRASILLPSRRIIQVQRVTALVGPALHGGPGSARGPAVGRGAHGAAPASSVRSRTRLYAALVKAKTHATWSRPR